MEVIDKRKESKDEDWNVGDVVNNNIHLAIIAKNNDGRYCLMDIDPQYAEGDQQLTKKQKSTQEVIEEWRKVIGGKNDERIQSRERQC